MLVWHYTQMAVTLVSLKQARSLLKTGEIMHNSATSFWTYSSHFMHWIQYNNLILKHFSFLYEYLLSTFSQDQP